MITYVVPMLQMVVSYSHICVVLWSKSLSCPPAKPRDSYSQQQKERAIVNKRKASGNLKEKALGA